MCIDLNFEPIASNAAAYRRSAGQWRCDKKELRDLSILFYDPRSEGNQLVIAFRHCTARDIKNRNRTHGRLAGDRTDNEHRTASPSLSQVTQHVTTKIEKVPTPIQDISSPSAAAGSVLEGTDTPDKRHQGSWDER